MDDLILVDEDDKVVGSKEKESCHLLPTTLHRAFSIFIVNSSGEILIHRRAEGKKTWPGFWTNACCSHPRQGESLEGATRRRLAEELGFTCPVRHLFTFRYQARFDDRYGEDEVDHVFLGTYDGPVRADPGEIAEWRWISLGELLEDTARDREHYTPWFLIALPGVMEHLKTS